MFYIATNPYDDWCFVIWHILFFKFMKKLECHCKTKERHIQNTPKQNCCKNECEDTCVKQAIWAPIKSSLKVCFLLWPNNYNHEAQAFVIMFFPKAWMWCNNNLISISMIFLELNDEFFWRATFQFVGGNTHCYIFLFPCKPIVMILLLKSNYFNWNLICLLIHFFSFLFLL